MITLALTRAILAAAVVGILVAAPGCADGGSDAAAEVEGVEISSSETQALVDEYAKSQSGKRFDLSDDEVAKLVLGYQIKLAYLEHLAEELAVAVDETEAEVVPAASLPVTFTATGGSPAEFARSVRADQLSRAIAEKLFSDAPIPEATLRAEFDRRASAFENFWRARVKVAYFTVTPTGELRTRVDSGEPFQEAAKDLGAERTGTIEITPLSDLPPALVDAVGRMRTGEVSDVVAVGRGGAVVQVEELESRGKLTFDAAKPELVTVLRSAHMQQLFLEWFDGRLKKARISVNDDYGRWHPDFASVE